VAFRERSTSCFGRNNLNSWEWHPGLEQRSYHLE
jgi:hypothetical protein